VTTRSSLDAWLVEHGFSPDQPHTTIGNRTTALMKASHTGNAGIVLQLVHGGADLNARNSDGNNALWLACVGASQEVIGILIGAGIDIDNRNDNQATCLMYAASTGKSLVLAQLLQAGANHLYETLDGFSALDMAATIDCLNLLRCAARQTRPMVDEALRC
jgi:thiosulfate/3-mercaptopyruvate sulfurtransferase